MLLVRQILVITIVLAGSAVGLGACGQQGPLYLPTEAAAANRATLPQTLLPSGVRNASESKAASNSDFSRRPAPAASAAPQ